MITDQYTRCRTCGGIEKANPHRLWDDHPTPACYCLAREMALEPDEVTGEVRTANGGQEINCNGPEDTP